MRFLDANVFIYAYYKPKPRLTEEQRRLKEEAKDIIKRISEGKERVVVTIIVHLSEVLNILKRALTPFDLQQFLIDLFSLDNVSIIGVSR